MKIFNKEYDGMNVAIWIILISVFVVWLVMALKTPAQPDSECTTEYVKINGTTDCDNLYKANDQLESENTNNYYN